MTKDYTITDFDVANQQIFTELNIAWLEKFFEVEPIDQKVLSDPETHIINKGGFIFFIAKDYQIVGTVALIKTDENTFELSKMAVNESCQGQGIGKKLMQHCFEFAIRNQIKNIILYSNTALEPAIHLYRKMGFTEVPVNQNLYKRANIKMQKTFFWCIK